MVSTAPDEKVLFSRTLPTLRRLVGREGEFVAELFAAGWRVVASRLRALRRFAEEGAIAPLLSERANHQ